MLDCNFAGIPLLHNLPAGIGCIHHPAVRTEGIHIHPELPAGCSNSDIAIDHNLHTAESSGQVGRIVLLVEMSLRLV